MLKLATRAAGLGIWDWDLASGRVTWSGEFHRLAGLGPGEIGETFDAFEDLLHPDDREDVRRGCAEARDRGGEYRGEHRILLPDGTIRWIAARGGALYDEATGAATRMVGVCMDITERKDLEQQIRDRAERLADADRRKDEFLAMLGHELRNPLAPIFHAVKLLELRDDDPELRVEMRALIDRQVRSLARLVDDLLDVSRITRGKIQLRKEAVDLAAVVARAVATSEPLIKARAHRLAVELLDRPVRLLADPLRLEQVLVNLVNNAAKYTDPGGSIRVEAAIEGGEVVVRVGDSGVGIAPELLPRIFDPFTQDERALRTLRGGAGNRADPGPVPGADARGERRGAERGTGSGQRVPRPPAAPRRRSRTGPRRARRPAHRRHGPVVARVGDRRQHPGLPEPGPDPGRMGARRAGLP